MLEAWVGSDGHTYSRRGAEQKAAEASPDHPFEVRGINQDVSSAARQAFHIACDQAAPPPARLRDPAASRGKSRVMLDPVWVEGRTIDRSGAGDKDCTPNLDIRGEVETYVAGVMRNAASAARFERNIKPLKVAYQIGLGTPLGLIRGALTAVAAVAAVAGAAVGSVGLVFGVKEAPAAGAIFAGGLTYLALPNQFGKMTRAVGLKEGLLTAPIEALHASLTEPLRQSW